MPPDLSLGFTPPVQARGAGLLISRGKGIHEARTLDSCELIFVRAGTLGIFEEKCRFEVRAGQALLLRQGRRHGGTEPLAPGLSYYWIHFRLRSAVETGRPVYRIRMPSLVTVRRPDRLTELYRHFLDDQETGCLTPLSADLMMMLILDEAADGRPVTASANDPAATLASRAERFIRLHFSEPLSTATIASALGCNPDYLGRMFNLAYGHTLTQAIHTCRHKNARAMLLEERLTIKEVAAACGFDDPGYFRRLFQRKEGLSPAAFRHLYAHMRVNTY